MTTTEMTTTTTKSTSTKLCNSSSSSATCCDGPINYYCHPLNRNDQAIVQTALAVIVIRRRLQQQQQQQQKQKDEKQVQSSSSLHHLHVETNKRPSDYPNDECIINEGQQQRQRQRVTDKNENASVLLSSSSSMTLSRKVKSLPFFMALPNDNKNHSTDPNYNDSSYDYWKKHLQHILHLLFQKEQQKHAQSSTLSDCHNSLYLHFACQLEQLLQLVTVVVPIHSDNTIAIPSTNAATTTTTTTTNTPPKSKNGITSSTSITIQQVQDWLYEQWTRLLPIPINNTTNDDENDENHNALDFSSQQQQQQIWYHIWYTILSMKPHVFVNEHIVSILLQLLIHNHCNPMNHYKNDSNDNTIHQSKNVNTSSSNTTQLQRIHYFNLLEQIIRFVTSSLSSLDHSDTILFRLKQMIQQQVSLLLPSSTIQQVPPHPRQPSLSIEQHLNGNNNDQQQQKSNHRKIPPHPSTTTATATSSSSTSSSFPQRTTKPSLAANDSNGNDSGSSSSSWYSIMDLANEYEQYYFQSPVVSTTASKMGSTTKTMLIPNKNDDLGETFLLIHGMVHLSEQMNH